MTDAAAAWLSATNTSSHLLACDMWCAAKRSLDDVRHSVQEAERELQDLQAGRKCEERHVAELQRTSARLSGEVTGLEEAAERLRVQAEMLQQQQVCEMQQLQQLLVAVAAAVCCSCSSCSSCRCVRRSDVAWAIYTCAYHIMGSQYGFTSPIYWERFILLGHHCKFVMHATV